MRGGRSPRRRLLPPSRHPSRQSWYDGETNDEKAPARVAEEGGGCGQQTGRDFRKERAGGKREGQSGTHLKVSFRSANVDVTSSITANRSSVVVGEGSSGRVGGRSVSSDRVSDGRSRRCCWWLH
jgi:hypothetical protein